MPAAPSRRRTTGMAWGRAGACCRGRTRPPRYTQRRGTPSCSSSQLRDLGRERTGTHSMTAFTRAPRRPRHPWSL
jgi:hypothetical protein